jgi:hypothetical protein
MEKFFMTQQVFFNYLMRINIEYS